MALKSSRHLPSLKRFVEKRATPGEQIMGRLFPGKGAGTIGVWSGDRIQQVQHMVDCSYVAIHTICMKLASIQPNMAWVTDANKRVPGVTTKVCDRGLMNAMGRGFGGSSHVSAINRPLSWNPPTELEKHRYERNGQTGGEWQDYSRLPGTDQMVGGGGSSYLTIGEYRSKALSVVKPHQELEPLESKHLLRRLIENPNPVDTHFDYRYELLMFKLLCGVAYEWVIPNSYGKPCERWVLPSHWVWPRTGDGRYADPDDDNAGHLIQYYEVRPWGGLGSAGMLKLPPDQVIPHIFKSPINKLDGYSKLWAFSRWVDTEESISKSRWAQFINQARPEFWVEMGPGFTDPDDNMIARWEAKIAAKHQGEFNTHKPLFMPAGAKAQVLSFSPEEMVYKDSMEQVWDMILVGFGLSRASVGLVTDMTFGSVLATLMSDCERCYNTLLAQEGEVETKHLASRFDEDRPAWSTTTGEGYGASSESTSRRCKLWYDVLSPADPAQVNSDLQVDLQGYAITPSEIRVLRGRKPYELGGDNPMVQGPGGIMPMPLNAKEDGDDLTDFVRHYSEAMAADKDSTKLGTQLSEEDLPKDVVTPPAEGDSQAVINEAQDDLATGGKVDKPNGKPSKSLVRKSDSDLISLAQYKRDVAKWEREIAKLQELVSSVYRDRYRGPKGNDNFKTDTARIEHLEFMCRSHRIMIEILSRRPDVGKSPLRQWQKRWLAKRDGPHEFGCVMALLEGEARQAVLNMAGTVADEDLADKGREDQPHVTVLYGLRDNDAGPVRQAVETFGTINAQLGQLDYFPADEHDVLIVRVESDDLHNMHGDLQQLPHTTTHPTYQPHVTLAYVKPGTGQHWVDQLTAGTEDEQGVLGIDVTFTELVFSPAEGTPTAIPVASYAAQEAGKRVSKMAQVAVLAGTIKVGDIVRFDPSSPWQRVKAVVKGNPVEVTLDDGTTWHVPPDSRMWFKTGEAKEEPLVVDKGIGSTVQSAGSWLADRWAQLEGRYGRKGALTMAVGMLATMPIPGNVAAIIAAAEAIRGVSAAMSKAFEPGTLVTDRNGRRGRVEELLGGFDGSWQAQVKWRDGSVTTVDADTLQEPSGSQTVLRQSPAEVEHQWAQLLGVNGEVSK